MYVAGSPDDNGVVHSFKQTNLVQPKIAKGVFLKKLKTFLLPR